MASAGRARLLEVKEALEACLPGCRWEEKKHRWWVYPPNGNPSFKLPQGEHGAGMRAEIERGHVRKMGRQFGVLPCLEREIEGL